MRRHWVKGGGDQKVQCAHSFLITAYSSESHELIVTFNNHHCAKGVDGEKTKIIKSRDLIEIVLTRFVENKVSKKTKG